MPKIVPVTVSHDLQLSHHKLPEEVIELVCAELTINNPARESAERAKRYGYWDIPKTFDLWDADDDTLYLPRGYALRLKQILRQYKRQVRWIDRRTWQKGPVMEWRKLFTPRLQQPRAIRKMRKHQQGIYEAPTGSGKSLTALAFIQAVSPRKAIILVNTKDLLMQWIREGTEWLGAENVGQYGSGKTDDSKRITVATVQTIWSKMKSGEIGDDWFDEFDVVIVDECHHTLASSIKDIVTRFSARIRIGESATPDRKTGLFEIIKAVLGPVFHADGEEELHNAGVLVKPHVEVIGTKFNFPYWRDHEADKDEDCMVPGCKKSGLYKHSHKNNYQKLKDALVYDEGRNALIAAQIYGVSSKPHHQIVITDEIRHVEQMHSALLHHFHDGGLPNVYVMTGQMPKKQRANLIQEFKNAREGILITTLAKEGMDIPVLDRVHMPWPTSNPTIAQQKAGRGTRTALGKDDAIIYDYVDYYVHKLKQQFRARRYGCYDKLKWEVRK